MTKLQKISTGNQMLIRKGFSRFNTNSYQNNFRAVDYKPDVVSENGSPVPLHEKVHMKVQHLESRKIVGILSSCEGKKGGFSSVKLNSIKVNGSFIPMKDKLSNEIIKDSTGKMLPDPNKGGQFCIFLSEKREVSEDLLTENEKATKYLQTYRQTMDNAYKENNIECRKSVIRKSSHNISQENQNNNKNGSEDL